MDVAMNAFAEVMTRFTASSFPDDCQDLWSKTCLEQFDARPADEYGYCFGQVFETHVLDEVARLNGKDMKQLEALDSETSERLETLRTLLRERRSFNTPARMNLAAALVSVSRFSLAERVLLELDEASLTNRDRFERASLDFVIANRATNVGRMTDCYAVLRRCIEEGGIPENRALSAASSAVVWHMKLDFLSAADFAWFEALGAALAAKPTGLDQGALSGWYRGVAMVPAAVGNREETRAYMRAAADSAHQAMALRPTHYETNLIKTYHESSVKEHMYVTRDLGAARESSLALIALDPIWSVSRGEYAECLAFFKEFEEAAKVFEEAAAFGPPYFGHHLFSAAQLLERIDNPKRALELYETLLELDPSQVSVIVAGTRLARQMQASAKMRFEAALADLPHLSARHAKYLQDAA